jgi:membrane protein implicated in regulation of membrane protease activity
VINPNIWSWICFALIALGGYLNGRNQRAGAWFAIANQAVFVSAALDMGMDGNLATAALMEFNSTLTLWRLRQRRHGRPDTLPAALRAWLAARRGATVYTLPQPTPITEEAA